MRRFFLAPALGFLFSLLAFGQVGNEASFFGTVTDTSGSVIPNAGVTVTHTATGLTKTTRTDEQGGFNFFALPIGKYTIGVTAAGFKSWKLENAELTVGDRSRVSPVLSVGELSESVLVEAAAELLQTEKSSAETVVQLRQIRELPLDTRNPLALVGMVPGMRVAYQQEGGERATYVQGQGLRQNKTAFSMDGVSSNAPMDEGGTGVPNVDAIAEFSVETLNFSAENGRNPMQVKIATKSGTNEFHGSGWLFNQNDAYNARNAYATSTPRVRRNQFGGALGGPVLKNRTFFYANFQGTVSHDSRLWYSQAATAAQKTGDFRGTSTVIMDPTNQTPFPNNVIPAGRINPASAKLAPYLLEANSPGGIFRDQSPTINDSWEGTGRIDHQLTASQRLSGRYVIIRQPSTSYGYSPSAITNDLITQHNLGFNYTWTLSANTVFSADGGMFRTRESYTSPELGKTNFAEEAGIQGFPTAGREKWIGLPNINMAGGYASIWYSGWGAPGALYGGVYNGRASVRHHRGHHTLAAGLEYANVTTYGDHGSGNVRGSFGFYNEYTGDGLADYLLGYASSSSRNAPLAEFGTTAAPYGGLFVNDEWRVRQNLTLTLGIRYERWFARKNARDASSTWDPDLQKVVAANDSAGNVNLKAFLLTPGVAAATQGLWVTARSAGYSDGLYEGNGNWAPRAGVVYRPFAKRELVVRGAYGLFYNTMTGNRSASSAANLPFWGVESMGYGLTQLQNWQTIWSADPNSYGIFSIWESDDPRLRPARTQEWNFTVQTALPFKSALTASYVGTRVNREVVFVPYNSPTVGAHDDLQAARPNPLIGSVQRLENHGRNWYHGLQTKLERRFSAGVAFTFAYAFSRSMGEGQDGSDEGTAVLPYSPSWYNRGRTSFDIRHVEYATLLWEMPVGHSRKYFSGMNRVADALVGGWNLTMTQAAQSGSPLSLYTTWNNLGNGNGSRADLVGDPHISNQSATAWFNTAAFQNAAIYTWGNSPLGVIDGPGAIQFNTALAKEFRITEGKQLQLRMEAFNVFNHVNLAGVNTSIGSPLFGQITSAGTARYLQLGAKFAF